MLYLSNGFSVSMIRFPETGQPKRVSIERIPACYAGKLLRENRFSSVYGHPQTAIHLERYLHIRVPVRRESIALEPGDELIVAKAVLNREYRLGFRGAPKWGFYRVRLCEDP